MRDLRNEPGPGPRGGVRAPLLAVAGGIVLLLAWMVLGAGPARDPGPASPVLLPEGAAPAPSAAVLEAAPLPGEGPLEIRLWPLGEQHEREAVVRRGGTLRGRVLDGERQPLAGVVLRIAGGPQDGVRARSGPDGSYALPGLLPGTQYLILEAPGLPPVPRLQQVLARNPTRRDFLLGPAIPVVLRVRGHDGKPLAGARVSADLGATEVLTDEEGLARLESVVSGPRVLVDLRAEGHVPVRHELNLAPGLVQGGEPVELPPLPEGGLIRGEVPSWPGPPRPRVTVVPMVHKPTGHHVIWETWHGVEVDEDGHFALEGLPLDQTVDIRVFHPRGVADPPLRSVRPGAYPSRIRFIVREVARTLEGRVVDESGTPVAGAEVLLEAEDPVAVLGAYYRGLAESPQNARLPVPAPVRRRLVTGPDGRFAFTYGDHPEGTGALILSARKEGYAGDRTVVRRARSEIVLRLRRLEETASLEIVARDGGPLPGEPPRWFLDGRQIESGAGLAPGWYRVEVWRGEVPVRRFPELRVEGRTPLPVR